MYPSGSLTNISYYISFSIISTDSPSAVSQNAPAWVKSILSSGVEVPCSGFARRGTHQALAVSLEYLGGLLTVNYAELSSDGSADASSSATGFDSIRWMSSEEV